MADTALFIGYGPTIPGREQRALALFNEVLGYYTRLQERGEIENFEAVLLEPHGGELGGFLLLRGEAEKLDRVRRSEEFLGYNAQAGLVVLNFGVVGAYIGAGLERQFAVFGKLLADLAVVAADMLESDHQQGQHEEGEPGRGSLFVRE